MSVRISSRKTIRFAGFVFDSDSNELFHDKERLELQLQPASVLALLLSRPGELVTRQEIKRNIWGESTHVDFDQSLNYSIRHLRKALDDNFLQPAYIETVPKRGYRFVARVRADAGGKSDELPLFAPRSASQATVAVYPFQMTQGEPAYLADGMTDAVISALSRRNQLRVVAIASLLQLRGGPFSSHEVPHSMEDAWLVKGSIHKSGRIVRVQAQLMRALDGGVIWGHRYDGAMGNVLCLHDQCAKKISSAVFAHLFVRNRASGRALARAESGSR